MKMITEFRSRVTPRLPAIVFILFIIQPIMDIISFWVAELGVSNAVTLLMRFGVLTATVLLGFTLSEKKTVYYVAAVICAIIGIGHIFAAWQFGYANPFTDLTNYVRVLGMPLTTLCLITVMKANRDCYRSLKKGILYSLFIIFSCQLLAVITKTEPHTYMDGMGFIGWFSNTNSQSAILTMAAPVAVVFVYRKKGLKSPVFWVTLLGSCISMYFFGTRLCYAGIVAMCLGLSGSMIMIRPSDWKRALAFIATAIVFVGIMPYSPMVRHQSQYQNVQSNRQESIDNMIESADKETDISTDTENDQPPPDNSLTKEDLIEILTPIYEFYAPDFVLMFGAEQTIEMFNYTTNIVEITSTRPKKLLFAELLMDNSPPSALFFGVELSRFTVNGNIYDVENDFHGIFYLYGGVGLAVLLLFIGYFLFLIAKALIKDAKKYFTLDAAAWGIALIMCIAHVYCTAGVLRRPGASFYMSAVLAAIFFLVKIKEYSSDNME